MRRILFLFFVILRHSLPAQDFIALPAPRLPNTSGCSHNPQMLVSRLTEGRQSEKEKFDAIFMWVAKNIRYDYYTYLAPSGSPMPQLNRILKHKTGICTDYAFLMDTLCQLAGIQNITVYGYAKDNVFDVGDSSYMDNHAWNAVKLDNSWYVYDATWAAGTYKLDYTRFSRFLIRMAKKLSAKAVVKTRTFRAWTATDCDSTGFRQQYISLPLINLVMLKILGVIPLRVHLVYDNRVNLDFYLSDPDVFALTHYPDDPCWSLVNKYATIRGFETDSAYYNLDMNAYPVQHRRPGYCHSCDEAYARNGIPKWKQLKSSSIAFNNKNRFMPSLCDYNIADLFYQESIPQTDSLTKISLLDSALSYLAGMKTELRRCTANATTDNTLQRTKNTRKLQLLEEENRQQLTFIHTLTAAANNAGKESRRFAQKAAATVKRLQDSQRKIRDKAISPGHRPKHFREAANVEALRLRYMGHLRTLDSLSAQIAALQSTYNYELSILSNRLWAKMLFEDTLAGMFEKSAFDRYVQLLDNYKKPVVELRKKIPALDTVYSANLHDSIYNLSDSCTATGMRVFSLFAVRNKLILETEDLLNVLVNENLASPDSIRHFVTIYTDLQHDNICWLNGGSSRIRSVIEGYKLMLKKMELLQKYIRIENHCEYFRYSWINKELNSRYAKFRGIPAHNMLVCINKKGVVTQAKRLYLKSLKDARKKAVKKSKKS